MSYDIGFIGTGSNPNDPNREGFAMAYRHAFGYRERDDCRLIACADIVRENAEKFAAVFDIDAIYEDYERMLTETRPDVVSVCVPPGSHADITIGCAETGIPSAIHCEKPMATTWEDCRQMVEICESKDIQLSFNHQRRFSGPVRGAKRLLSEDAIGELQRIEFSAQNLYDTGTHLFDICTYLTDGSDVEWVMGQVDYREENVWFGAHNENHGLATWRYADGTHGLAVTGEGEDFVDCYLRLRGSDGCIEIDPSDGPILRVDRGSGWESVSTDREGLYGVSPSLTERIVEYVKDVLPFGSASEPPRDAYTARAINTVIGSLEEGRRCEIDGRTTLKSTELIFASWESARRRARIELPLEIDDNPLEAMVETGELDPRPSEVTSNRD